LYGKVFKHDLGRRMAYFFGRALEVLIGKFKSYEMYIMGSVAIGGVLVWILNFYRHRRQRAKLVAKVG